MTHVWKSKLHFVIIFVIIFVTIFFLRNRAPGLRATASVVVTSGWSPQARDGKTALDMAKKELQRHIDLHPDEEPSQKFIDIIDIVDLIEQSMEGETRAERLNGIRLYWVRTEQLHERRLEAWRKTAEATTDQKAKEQLALEELRAQALSAA